MTAKQYAEVKALAVDRGFACVSDYVRFLVLQRDFALYDLVHEIHRRVCSAKEKRDG